MNAKPKTALLSAIGIGIVLLVAVTGCLDASVSGTITYRERLALTPGATLVVQLRDVSLQDTASILIAEQVIPNPGQVPIAFKVEYNKDDLNPRNTYSIGARIIESDGRLAFINDTAYEVITRGKPDKVDMELVLVEPPPDPSNSGDKSGSSKPSWVEVPAPVVGAQVPQENSVTGTITYRERLALTPGATLVVQLRDVSLQDTASILIAEQVIPNPGQVPIAFKIEYDKDNINPRNTYSISARIRESDGRLAFINDTAYEVITRGKPNKVDMVLVLVEPPPDPSNSGNKSDSNRLKWVEVPVPIVGAKVLHENSEYLLLVTFHQSSIEGCVRPGGEELEVKGADVNVTVTLMQPPPTPWAIPCAEEVLEVETIVPMRASFAPGKTYRVKVNGRITTAFTLLEPDFPDSFIALSPIQRVAVVTRQGATPQYELRVVSALPLGSRCSKFNGYEVRRANPTRIEVDVTHHAVADPAIRCTKDYPLVETSIPLGSDFEPGLKYKVSVNSDKTKTFLAR